MRAVRAMLLILAAVSLSGCLTVVRPTIAHVHVGHTTAGWVDTPDRVGLLTVVERESQTAADNAGLAFRSGRDPAELKRRIGFAMHALDPTLEQQGPGTGYGLIRAVDGAIDHLRFAADSEDASKNLKDSVLDLETTASRIRQGAKVAVAIGQEIRGTSKQEDLLSLAEEMKNQTATLVRDTGAWRRQIDEMLARENPPFTRIEQRYLFGLIRLPSGLWQWRPDVDKASNQGMRPAGY